MVSSTTVFNFSSGILGKVVSPAGPKVQATLATCYGHQMSPVALHCLTDPDATRIQIRMLQFKSEFGV